MALLFPPAPPAVAAHPESFLFACTAERALLGGVLPPLAPSADEAEASAFAASSSSSSEGASSDGSAGLSGVEAGDEEREHSSLAVR